MREGDPLDFQMRALPEKWKAGDLRDLDIMVAYEEDLTFIMECQRTNDIKRLIAYIERGRVHRPGDALPPVPLRRT